MSSNTQNVPAPAGLGAGNRIPRAIYTHVLDFTPHIPSICIACAHPLLRYSREAVAGVRVQHEEKHRGDLYLCCDEDERKMRNRRRLSLNLDLASGGNGSGSGGGGGFSREGDLSGRWRQQEYHRLEGVLEHVVSDLVLSGWWLGRRLPGRCSSGSSLDASVPASFYNPNAEEQETVMRSQRKRIRALTDANGGSWFVSEDVVPLEVDIKRVENAADAEATTRTVAALLKLLASPPFQSVQGNVIVSCLRSLILTPRSLNLADETGCLPLLHSLPLLANMESFASSFGSLGPQALPCLSVLKIHNASIESLDCLRGQRHLQLLDISRCNQLQDVSAVAELRSLRELSISNSRQLSMQGDYSKCMQLTTVSLLWCPLIRDVAAVLSALRLSTLNLSYSHVEDITRLLEDHQCRGRGLCTLLLRGCPDSAELLDALPDPDRESDTQTSSSATAVDKPAEQKTQVPPAPKVLLHLENVDLALSDAVDDQRLKRLSRCCPHLRQVNVRECALIRSLSALSCVASSLEAVDASYTPVSDINGLTDCSALRSIRLRDCFRLKNLAPLTTVADTLEEVDATMSTKVNAWSRDVQSEEDGYFKGLFSSLPSPKQGAATAPKRSSEPSTTSCAIAFKDLGNEGERVAATKAEMRDGLPSALEARRAVEQADLLELLRKPLQPGVVSAVPRELQAGGFW